MPHSYENYAKKSETYSNVRKAIALEEQLAHFSKNKLPLDEQDLFDGGCGTGHYSIAYAPIFHSVRGLDYNEKMLMKAKENMVNKLGRIPDNVKFTQGNICHLKDFDDDCYDAVCVNQVFHHLRPDDDFRDLRNAIGEIYRILRPDGRFVINISTYECAVKGIFWAPLLPKAVEKFGKRAPTKEKYEEIMNDIGFKDVYSQYLPNEIIYNNAIYYPKVFLTDLDGIVGADSRFALSDKQEILSAVEKVREMANKNELEEWFEEREASRRKSGQTMNVYGVKK